ncbi:hypothetical protein MLD52_17170 [Puniceicoccaceae bacterium K14]|nr:hypothetical protein [Puniceicoccaceae bacterium K14]
MNRVTAFSKIILLTISISVLLFNSGCAGPAASKTAKGTGTGAAVGAIGAAVTGQDAGGIIAGGAAGALIGGVIGAVQEGKERKRQDTLAQQRAHNQSIAMQKRAEEKEKARLQEELDIAEGFRISETELDEVTERAESAESKLKKLQAKRDAALERKRELDEMEQREEDALNEIARLEKELAELEGSDDLQEDLTESIE